MNKQTDTIPVAALKTMYTTMLRIRRVEEVVADLVSCGEILCPCHLYIGQEAIAAGVCATLRSDDYVFSTHRSHGHYIAKGGDIRAMMAELYGKETGCSRGRGGSMHLVDPKVGLPGSSAIVANTIPLAVGAALASHIHGKDTVSVAFFGDGATNEGAFYESLNLASLNKLPIVFVCENNLYSTHMHIGKCLADTDIYKKASVFDMPGVRVDGNNAIDIFLAAHEAVDRARSGKGPSLIEGMTYRWRGHVGPNFDIDKGLRSEEELKSWMERGPIVTLEKYLNENGAIPEKSREQIKETIEKEIKEALKFAKESPLPHPDTLLDHVYRCENN